MSESLVCENFQLRNNLRFNVRTRLADQSTVHTVHTIWIIYWVFDWWLATGIDSDRNAWYNRLKMAKKAHQFHIEPISIAVHDQTNIIHFVIAPKDANRAEHGFPFG